MMNDHPCGPEGASPLRPNALRTLEETGGILFLLGLAMGGLRAIAIVAPAPGALISWVEAAYAWLLHVGAAYLICDAVRVVGVRLCLQQEAARETSRQAGEVVPEPSDPPSGSPEVETSISPDLWRARLDAAREAGDAARVLELREEAPDGLEDEALKALDAELGKWFLTLVHHRLRSGPLQLDLVILVARVSEAFGHTREGASLRAALPTLRRGAGLCPRCAKPYAGVWEACPECMGRPEPPPPVIPGLVAVEDEDYDPPATEERWFIDPDEVPDAEGRSGP